MPELPEVQTVVDTLKPRVMGARIDSIEHLRADIVEPKGFDFSKAVEHRTVASITRRAKRIVFRLDDGNHFYIHLGMSGRLTVEKPDEPVLKHTHFRALLSTRFELRFRDPRRFGGIFWIGKSLDASEASLGPEPLTQSLASLASRLKKTKRAIKNALLDQRLIAGLGNIYVDESLFMAKIHPLKRADRLRADEVMRLNAAIKKTLRRAILHKGSTLRDFLSANGDAGGYQRLHRVYGREGEACPSCKAPVHRIVVGGRSTHFCKRCQRKT